MMTTKQTRREFVKRTTAGIAGIAATQFVSSAVPSSEAAQVKTVSPKGQIAVWLTSGEARYAAQAPLTWQAAPKPDAREAIRVAPDKMFQDVLGFGAAFTDAACWNFDRLAPADREKLFSDLYSPSQMNLSVGRVCMGSSDYATKLYSYNDSVDPDPELTKFSIAHDRGYILPALREARALNPDLWLLASPWSPPGWMKFNNSMLGGSMRRKWLPAYAQYFHKFLAAYEKEGVRIDSVSPQNEVDTDQDGRMPACAWPQEYEIEFVRDHLGPVLARQHPDTHIWILDHNYNLWGRAICELEDEGARKYIKGVAWHGYVGDPSAMTRVHERFPEIGQFWTEGGPDYTDPKYQTDWPKWSKAFTDILRNRARCIIAWNYALDEVGTPNIGPFPCGGLVTVHSKTRQVTHSGQYWALAHFSRHVRRGARVVSTVSAAPVEGVSHVAFVNPDGSNVAVLTNTRNTATAVPFAVGQSQATVHLPADSVTTLVWK